MVLIGDYFSLLMISILCLFYFGNKYLTTTAGKYFLGCLVLTALTSLIDTLAVVLMSTPSVPVGINIAVNTVYFLINILTTTFIALVLFAKILEHVHDDFCMKRAKRALTVVFGVYALIVLSNLFTGWLFRFDENGDYVRGFLNSIGYFVPVVQMVLVGICYFRHRKNVTRPLRRSIIQAFPLAIFCILVQISMPDILLNGLIMAMVDLILFLNFYNQQLGVHTLTKLNDRHTLFKHVEDCIADKNLFRIYVISIQNFDAINQKYGHKSGDEILYQFAFALEKLIRHATAYHLNSVSFALVVPMKEKNKSAEDHIDKINRFLEDGVPFSSDTVSLNCRIVEHELKESHFDPNEFYEELEYGIDLAAQNGVRYLRYTDDMTAAMHRKRYLIRRMEKVDREHGFEVWFQPIRCLHNDRFCSMEALVRLREPNGVLISPAEFIPIAEQSDMIAPITYFVIEEACRVLSSSSLLKEVSVSINLPMAQLLDESFEERLNRIVDTYGISHRQICLEFTERVMLNDFETTKEAMEKITANGYRFYLDDFGTGLSNFNCLLQLPFTTIKLDRTLTTTVTAADRDEVGLVPHLTDIFHKMNLTVVAEGVETAKEVSILRSYGIDFIQGYYFATPMPQAKLLDFYAALE